LAARDTPDLDGFSRVPRLRGTVMDVYPGSRFEAISRPEVKGYLPIRESRNMPRRSFQVGKSTVNSGTTRIRRYVIETPVEREVSCAIAGS
jgi:hypothetical protein